MPQPRRPEVTLTRSSLPLGPSYPVEPRAHATSTRRLGPVAAVAAGLLLAGAVTAPGPTPAPAGVPDAALVVQSEDLTVTLGGVLVLPVEVRNDGIRLQVRTSFAYAEPVVADPVAQPPMEVAAGATRRFVALVAPDCRLLRPGSPIEFRATVLLRVGVGSESRDLIADLAAAPGVRERVAGLCRGR